MIYTKPEMVLLAERAAIENAVEPALLCALVDVSSNWEAGKAEWDSHAVFQGEITDELLFQTYRWGLTQVSGAMARHAGFKLELYELLNPDWNLDIGAKAFAEMLRLAGTTERGLAFWQGSIGGNFPAMVLSKVQLYRDFLADPKRAAPLEARTSV